MIDAVAMTYLVKRKDRLYVVVYDGLDALTGSQRRRCHPVGTDRQEVEIVVAWLQADRVDPPPTRRGRLTVGEYLTGSWLPLKRRQVRATTTYRYAWFPRTTSSRRSARSRWRVESGSSTQEVATLVEVVQRGGRSPLKD